MIKHVHNWQLAKYFAEKYGTESIVVGRIHLDLPSVLIVEKERSLFVCECGQKKEVLHDEEKENNA